MRPARQPFQHLTTADFWRLIAGMNVSQNAKFALVVAEAEKSAHGVVQEQKWKEFLYTIQTNLRPSAAISKIHENVWLIPLDTEMRFLTQLFDWANGTGIRLRILFLDAEPDWLQYPKLVEAKSS